MTKHEDNIQSLNFKKDVSLYQKCFLVLKKQPKIAEGLRVSWRCDVWIIEGCSEGPGNLIPGATGRV